jgi:hypothetical protein
MIKIYLVDGDSEFRKSEEAWLRDGFKIRGVDDSITFFHLNSSGDFASLLRSQNGDSARTLTVTDQIKAVRFAKVVKSPPIFYDAGFNLESRGKKAIRFGAVSYFGKRNKYDELHFTDLALEILQNGSNPRS